MAAEESSEPVEGAEICWHLEGTPKPWISVEVMTVDGYEPHPVVCTPEQARAIAKELMRVADLVEEAGG